MVPPAQHSHRKIVATENRLTCLVATAVAAGTKSPWQIDADSRAVLIIAIVIVIVARCLRPTAISIARLAE